MSHSRPSGGEPFASWFLRGYAARAEQLIVTHGDTGMIALVGTNSGQVRETSISAHAGVAIDPNANRLFAFATVRTTDLVPQRLVVSAYDVASATVSARRTADYPFMVGQPEYDASTGRLFFFASLGTEHMDLVALDASSLEVIAAVDVAGGPSTSFTIAAVPANPYVLMRSHQPPGRGCSQTSLHLLDANGASRATADVAALWAPVLGRPICSFTTTYLGPPAPPVGLRASVLAQRVYLAWEDITAAADFEVEVGSAPTLRNLGAIRSGGPLSLTVDNVPAGTYFVRVVGLNHQGRSAPSRELVLTVP